MRHHVLAGCALLAAAAPLLGQEPFNAYKNPYSEVVNFNIETVRGLAVRPGVGALYALNTHGSRLLQFSGFGGASADWATLHNPIALALWGGPEEQDWVLVLGGGTHALVAHERTNGRIVRMLPLESEPGDLLVAGDQAFVSCMGADVVLQIDLPTFSEVQRFTIPSQRPRNLSAIPNGEGFRIFVAPFLSGNNTTRITRNQNTINPGAILSEAQVLGTPGTAAGLPDVDLFELIVETGAVEERVRGLGHLILDHGRANFPGTLNDGYWVLSIDPKNADPNRQNEPALAGDFATNALTILDPLPAAGSGAIQAPASIDLDVPNGTGTSCAFPYAIDFHPQSGRAFIAASMSDRVIVTDVSGARTSPGVIQLPAGSIPRDLLAHHGTQTLTVYCWGTNELRLYNLADLTPFLFGGNPVVLSLGTDPTPAPVARGREIWYDADVSLNERSSCNTCHPGGSSDFLGWQLSGHPEDHKDVMVTQSLLSIEDTFPYHWRGERQLRDFTRLGFPGILAADPLVGEDFEDFKEFVFSLQVPRNPRESLDRMVAGASAQEGQRIFTTGDQMSGTPTVGPFNCVDCHLATSGTIGDISGDNATSVPSNLQLDVAHFRQIWDRDGEGIVIPGLGSVPPLGFGISHDGNNDDVFDFLGGTFDLDGAERRQVADFVEQFDPGIAPAAQLGWLIDENAPDSALINVDNLLLAQANLGWLDLVAFGTVTNDALQVIDVRWLYDPTAGLFLPDDPSVHILGGTPGSASWTELRDLASAGEASNVFLGIAPGSGRVFAHDPENDDRGDVAGAPALVAGYPVEIDVTASTAEYVLRFSEPVTYTIRATPVGGGPSVQRVRRYFVVDDRIVLQELKPSSMASIMGVQPVASAYDVVIDMVDLGGVTASFSLPNAFTTREHLEPFLETGPRGTPDLFATQPVTQIVSDLRLRRENLGGSPGFVMLRLDVTIDPLHEFLRTSGASIGFVPEEGKTVIGRLLRSAGGTGPLEVVPASQLVTPQAVVNYHTAGGPEEPLEEILFTPATDASGQASIVFGVQGTSPGDVLTFAVIGIFSQTGSMNGEPVVSPRSRRTWQMPLTEDDPGSNFRTASTTL